MFTVCSKVCTCFTTWEALWVIRYSAASMALRMLVTLAWGKTRNMFVRIGVTIKFELSRLCCRVPHRQVVGHPLQQLDTLAQGALCKGNGCQCLVGAFTNVTTRTTLPHTHTHTSEQCLRAVRQRLLTRALTYFCQRLMKEEEEEERSRREDETTRSVRWSDELLSVQLGCLRETYHGLLQRHHLISVNLPDAAGVSLQCVLQSTAWLHTSNTTEL